MGRNYAKLKAKEQAARSLIAERMDRCDPTSFEQGPSKAEQRAIACAAMADYTGNVKRLPMVVALRCACGHRATVRVPHDRKSPRFRCSRCGALL